MNPNALIFISDVKIRDKSLFITHLAVACVLGVFCGMFIHLTIHLTLLLDHLFDNRWPVLPNR